MLKSPENTFKHYRGELRHGPVSSESILSTLPAVVTLSPTLKAESGVAKLCSAATSMSAIVTKLVKAQQDRKDSRPAGGGQRQAPTGKGNSKQKINLNQLVKPHRSSPNHQGKTNKRQRTLSPSQKRRRALSPKTQRTIPASDSSTSPITPPPCAPPVSPHLAGGPVVIPTLDHPVGGCLSRFVDRWSEIGAKSWVMSILTQGYAPSFLTAGPPPLSREWWICESTCSGERLDLLRQEVESLPLKQAIEVVSDKTSLGYYARLFLVTKKNGKYVPSSTFHSEQVHSKL